MIVGVQGHLTAEVRETVATAPSKMETAQHGKLAFACFYGCRRPQDFLEARRQAQLAGSEDSGIIVEALCLGRARGGDQEMDRALKVLRPLLLKGEPLAHAAAAMIMGAGRATGPVMEEELAREFREELAAVSTYDPAARTEHTRLALAGLEPRGETDAVASLVAGELLAWGVGIPKDEARAEKLFERAWALGCSDAANQLGNLYNQGDPARRDKALAVRWFRRGVEAGNAVAKMNLAQFDPTTTPADWLSLMTAASEAGHPDAMMLLGMKLWIGSGRSSDPAAGRKWLEKAVAGGSREALARFGQRLREKPENDGDRQRGLHLLRQALARESETAAYFLSLSYLNGEPDLPANPGIGYLLAVAAVRHGQNDAWAALGQAYAQGLGVKQDVQAARKCLESGTELGSSSAAFNLGVFLANGIEGKPDQQLAFQKFLLSTQLGDNPRAVGEVGARLFQGNGVERDQAAAVAWLRKAAALADPKAMEDLGIAYGIGAGVAIDRREAVRLFRASAEAGNAGGMVRLALILQQGKGLPADPEAAMPWLQKAATLGVKEAFTALYYTFENGIGTKIDHDEAKKWLLKGAEAGDPRACNWLGEAYRTGRMGAPSPEMAFHWYEKSAELGYPTGINNLGCCYQFGQGVNADPNRAFALYTRAVELGEPMALINLAICHEKGIGTLVNLEKATELRRQAAAMPPK